jgi:prevent-host-death family protein
VVAESRTWPVAEAKTHLSEVIDRALSDGPQTITRRGRATVVIVSAEEWARKTQRKGTLSEFFRNSPLYDSGIDLERIHDEPREIDW